jgi:RNA polymerase sigma-70 factor (ECF subfamily)
MVSGGSTYSDESELVGALRRGDESAFGALLDRYDASLRRVARQYVASDAIADEVVQDTWLGVIRGIERFEQRSSLKTWLYRILVNVARTKGVREKRTVPFSSVPGALEEGVEPTFDPDRFRAPSPDEQYPGGWRSFPLDWAGQPESSLLSGETLDVVRTALERLPPAQREVLTLRDVEEWSSVEVCNALGLTETNQRVLLHRARARVRRALEVYFEDALAS